MRNRIYIWLIVSFISLNIYSQSNVHDFGIKLSGQYYSDPAVGIGYIKKLRFPIKNSFFVSNSIELIFNEEKKIGILSVGNSYNIIQAENGLNLSVGISVLLLPEFFYSDSEELVDFGLRPEICIGYKNVSVGYQYNRFIFNETASLISHHNFVVYYKLMLWDLKK